MKILIVEDNISRQTWFRETLKNHDIIIAKSSKEAISLLQMEKFNFLFLDHDLGMLPDGLPTEKVLLQSEKNTGYEVAEYMVDNDVVDIPVIIHSWNIQGAKNISNILPFAKSYPFAMPPFENIIKLINEGHTITICQKCKGTGYEKQNKQTYWCSSCSGQGLIITKEEEGSEKES